MRNTALKLLLYSERPLHATPQPGSTLRAMPARALEAFVSRATAEHIIYGEEGLPEDLKRQAHGASNEADVQNDPTVPLIATDRH